MKIAFLFAGQGSQIVGMGKDLYDNYPIAKKIYDSAKLDIELKKICFLGPKEILDQTIYAQPAILATSLSIAKILENNNIIPSSIAGLSLGEYSALAFADSFSIEDAIKIVYKRGKIMQDALIPGQTGMAAILNLDASIILNCLKEIEGVCEIANYNCPGQIVITGDNKSIDEACDKLTKLGARKCIKLNVSGAFHSSYLEEASNILENELSKYPINKPKYEVIYNAFGSSSDLDIVQILKKQIKTSVYFEQSVKHMINNGIDTFIEIGPGSTLSSFVRKIDKDVKVLNAFDKESIERVMSELK